MKDYRYTIILQPEAEEGGYAVSVPSLPGCLTQGETIEEAIANAKEAIAVYLDDLIASGEPIPVEAEPAQALTIRVAA